MKLNKKMILLFIIACFLTQAIIITYNHYTGFAVIKSLEGFIVRLTIATLFSSFYLGLAYAADSKVIAYLDIKYPWKTRLVKRIISDAVLIIAAGTVIGIIFTLIANVIFRYKDSLNNILIVNSLISVVANVIIVSIYEGIRIFRRSIEAQLTAEKLEKENSLIRFEILKNQINPHFLFNSLNVLSALINKDQQKAQNFIDEFSMVYRYILDVIDKQVVALKEELQFANSYIYLQQIRFGNTIKVDIKIDASLMDYLVPPLSIQTLLENVIKHNTVSAEMPLNISICGENNYIFVSNNLQLKASNTSKGIGLANLKKRYAFLTSRVPEFKIENGSYIAKLPLITPN